MNGGGGAGAEEGAPVVTVSKEGAEAAAPAGQIGGAAGGGVYMFINSQIGGSNPRPSRGGGRGRMSWAGMTPVSQMGGDSVGTLESSMDGASGIDGAEIKVEKLG